MDRVPRGGARALVGMCLPTLHLGRDPSGPYGGASLLNVTPIGRNQWRPYESPSRRENHFLFPLDDHSSVSYNDKS
jgi:hypothetical protein